MSAYEVGQRVWIYDVNDRRSRGPREGTVTKVGRALVTVADVQFPAWAPQTFRIEDGRRNDKYAHQWIKTEQQRRRDERDAVAYQRLRDLGIRFDVGSRRLPVEVMEALADLVERTPSEGSS